MKNTKTESARTRKAKVVLTMLPIFFLLTVLTPSIFASDCSYEGILNLTDSTDSVLCENIILGLSTTTDFIINGNLTLQNTTIEFASGGVSFFTFQQDSNFILNKSTITSAQEYGAKNGRASFVFKKDSVATMFNSTIECINQSGFVIATNNLSMNFIHLNLSDGNIILQNINFTRINNLSANTSFEIYNVSNTGIKDSTFIIKNSTIIKESPNFWLNSSVIFYTVDSNISTDYLTIQEVTPLFLNNVTFANITLSNNLPTNQTIFLNRSYLNCMDLNCSNISILDTSTIAQYWSLNYHIIKKYTDLTIPGVLAQVSRSDNYSQVIFSDYSNINGDLKLFLMNFHYNISKTNYYNYSVNLSKDGYKSVNETYNLTNYLFKNISFETKKGIVPVGNNCTIAAKRIFCTGENPLYISDFRPGSTQTISYVVNATGNGFSVINQTYGFFITAKSSYPKVIQNDSAIVNITIIS